MTFLICEIGEIIVYNSKDPFHFGGDLFVMPKGRSP